MRKIGVIGIIVFKRSRNAFLVNKIISKYSHIIFARNGLPFRKGNIGVITLIVDGNTDIIGALTGKLGEIRGVKVKSFLVSLVKENDLNGKNRERLTRQ